MKITIVLVIVAVVAVAQAGHLSDEIKAMLHKHKEECVEETSVSEDLLTKAKSGDIEDDDALHEFMFCFNKKIGFQNDDGHYEVDTMKEKMGMILGADVAEEIVNTCTAEDHGDGKDNAVHLMKCYHEHSPDHHDFDDE